jgi:glutathione S-transferase kappa 1
MRLELFYDIVSPYSFLAFEVLRRYRPQWHLDLVLRPAFLGGVMKSTGNTPPATLPAKAPYLLRDLGRLSSWFGVPLSVPNPFPGNTLQTMRLCMATSIDAPTHLEALSGELWRRHWQRDDDVGTPAGLKAGCLAAGIDDVTADRLVARIAEPAIKDALKANTDEAVERGAFGFPAMLVKNSDGGDELYFGQDRLELIAFEHKLPWQGPNPSKGAR